MNKKTNKPGVGKSFLGFLLTIILMGTLVSSGFLLGLKTTVLKGNDVESLVESLNIYESALDIISSEGILGDEGEMIGDIVTQYVSEDMLQEVTNLALDSIRNDQDIDLFEMKDSCMESVQGIAEGAMDKTIEIIESTPGEINAESLAENVELQALQAQFGVDISGMVLSYMEENYGTTSISPQELNLESMKEEVLGVLDTELISEIEAAVDEVLYELNDTINAELDNIKNSTVDSLGYSIPELITLFEDVLKSITMGTVINLIIAVVLVILEILLYKKYMNRGVRNVGIAALLSGLLVSVIGAAFNVAKDVISEMSVATEPIEEIVISFIEQNIGIVGNRIIVIGVVYLAISIICFVFAGILKKRINKQLLVEPMEFVIE